jgi:hypothetical protein
MLDKGLIDFTCSAQRVCTDDFPFKWTSANSALTTFKLFSSPELNIKNESSGRLLLFQFRPEHKGCQMVWFQTKNINLGIFLRAFEWKRLVYFMAINNILQLLGIFCGILVYFVIIWYILWYFGTLCDNLAIFPVLVVVPRKIWQP